MKYISWNVNGLRACMKKGFKDFFLSTDADVFAIQETKMQENQKDFFFDGYFEYWNNAEKLGYSGTLIYTKQKPLNVVYGLFGDKYNDEGRTITLEYNDFYFMTVYSPNSQKELERLEYRMTYETHLLDYLKYLEKTKPVILCGDLNVAHTKIDIKNAKQNERNAGFTIEERTKFQTLLDSGFTDTFRYLYPDKIEYSWWSYLFHSRDNNAGWRIDYFITSNTLRQKIKDAQILTSILGSDHCPVLLEVY
ncbi:MAG: exodeoxyribonuclease III [Firmicutes bacterium]|nr:exodeoxyribonuclease III [Bacillota bacterium]